MPYKSLSEILRPYRQDGIAEAVGVSEPTAANWWHDRTSPRDEHVPKLASFLRISVTDLVGIIAEDRKRRSLERLGATA